MLRHNTEGGREEHMATTSLLCTFIILRRVFLNRIGEERVGEKLESMCAF